MSAIPDYVYRPEKPERDVDGYVLRVLGGMLWRAALVLLVWLGVSEGWWIELMELGLLWAVIAPWRRARRRRR